MKTKDSLSNSYFLFFLITVLVFTYLFATKSMATGLVKVMIDGEEFTSSSSPFIENGRTLIPIRFISEELGADVNWDGENRVVTIKNDDITVRLKIDSRLVQYKKDEEVVYGLTDVAPKIIDGHTFVPLRLVSNALGVGVEWNKLTRTAYIDTSQSSNIVSFFDVEITSLEPGQAITGKTKLQTALSDKYLKNGNQIKYLLLNPDTAKGIVIARGEDLTGEYMWVPDLDETGDKVLVAAIYDKDGQFIAGDSISVNVDVAPKVSLEGVTEDETFDDSICLGIDTNFVASKVKYEITNLDTEEVIIIGEDIPQDPYGQYKWEPKIDENGNYLFKAIVYDTNGETHESNPVNAKVRVDRKLSLTGITDGQIIDKPVNLMASRNFDVSETKYVLRNPNTDVEEIIAEIPYGNYTWFPGPELEGSKEVFVRVKDTQGATYESEPITVTLKGTPIVLLDCIGPNQVLTEPTNLKIKSNVDLDSVKYIITNQETGKQKTIIADADSLDEQIYNPAEQDIGYWSIKAVAKYNNEEISSEEIPFRVYLGKIYEPVSIVNKNNYVDEYIQLASKLARDFWEDTGMSAALQTAQSILETGWGQNVPVDKYSGKLSYNLFGIKGKGPVGSVTINTWEVYNGQTYHVDAEFRAYNSVEESWIDHKSFLLDSSRYESFKKVMHDSTQGAWALKRSGYATDPEYATKLMRIINQYNLKQLDKIGI
ncbi:glucosaminidase domain-containing protein [Schnuerera sp. xch1]|uniref:stalk domain-containing protein n=1 Tax=Schnuerera sp. xch1 TaxID=2874283 RepID=UPI001CBBA570|nr:stalk domain-containing protein [Schnuerera sp. xch1]MBZ2174402.1 glucosaminidase domain-containing protein [Schnuerera sp. xch1]